MKVCVVSLGFMLLACQGGASSLRRDSATDGKSNEEEIGASEPKSVVIPRPYSEVGVLSNRSEVVQDLTGPNKCLSDGSAAGIFRRTEQSRTDHYCFRA